MDAMIDVAIPGFGQLHLTTLVCDYNGTLARDGVLLDHVRTRLPRIAEKLRVHVVTGDTFGTVHNELRGIPCEIGVMPPEDQAEAKVKLITRLGAQNIVAIGNGRNDRLMLAAVALGIGVVGDEGMAGEAQQASDVVVRHIVDAFELLLEPRRLVATLRG
jgi:soluble P-type ATPase